MTMIEVRGLAKHFGPVRAVDDVSFTVTPGTLTGFLGPNGAGKPTTRLGHLLVCLQIGRSEATSSPATLNDFPHDRPWPGRRSMPVRRGSMPGTASPRACLSARRYRRG